MSKLYDQKKVMSKITLKSVMSKTAKSTQIWKSKNRIEQVKKTWVTIIDSPTEFEKYMGTSSVSQITSKHMEKFTNQ